MSLSFTSKSEIERHFASRRRTLILARSAIDEALSQIDADEREVLLHFDRISDVIRKHQVIGF